MAQGGRSGDGYAPYPYTTVDLGHTISSIEKMFEFADVGLTLSICLCG